MMRTRILGMSTVFPSANKLEAMKKMYAKMKEKYGPKMLYEYKMKALEAAKEEKSNFNISVSVNEDEEGKRELSRDTLNGMIAHILRVVKPLFQKLTASYRSDRRECLGTQYYLEIVRDFESKKAKIFNFSVKSVCKLHEVKKFDFIRSFNKLLSSEEGASLKEELRKLGLKFAICPKTLDEESLKEILEFYLENITRMVKGKQLVKYSLPVMEDLIYQNFGLEEEQIRAFIEKNKAKENNKLAKLLEDVDNMVFEVLGEVFGL